ncbi:hypothetical protein RchiOBHm_Chr7g0219081 [Rosa chinensis]|uniref:Uncharacterized protein n=1 Tax=Rosa chinensis TaxID=74649 RepID=A0A2P6PCF6_ROSCH|nr:hypothetical protein RchiOBHm_Chr7g0219081 [Rosa chinensis]
MFLLGSFAATPRTENSSYKYFYLITNCYFLFLFLFTVSTNRFCLHMVYLRDFNLVLFFCYCTWRSLGHMSPSPYSLYCFYQ